MESFIPSPQLHFHALNEPLISYPLLLPGTTAKPLILLKLLPPEPPPPSSLVVITPSKLSTIRLSPKLLMLTWLPPSAPTPLKLLTIRPSPKPPWLIYDF
ncbi:hypothetical protein RYX36_004861 [Vicia faba]